MGRRVSVFVASLRFNIRMDCFPMAGGKVSVTSPRVVSTKIKKSKFVIVSVKAAAVATTSRCTVPSLDILIPATSSTFWSVIRNFDMALIKSMIVNSGIDSP